MKILKVHGSHIEMGRQHAAQMQSLRPAVLRAIEARQAELDRLSYDFHQACREASAFMAEFGQPTWNMLRGIGEGLAIDWHSLQRYTLSSYLIDYQYRASSLESYTAQRQEGCTSFAVSSPSTADGATLLAKNRDYHLDHIALQSLTYATPAIGYEYLHLGSVGSPGVFSSGMNERGLAVADTHVLSLDIGPGLPRYALMMDLLERCDSVPAAVEYLTSTTHMGAGTLVLADAAGRLATCESAYSSPHIEVTSGGWVLRSNHFVSTALSNQWLDTEQPQQRGNSQARFSFAALELARSSGAIDITWAQALLSSHAEGLSRICRHNDNRIESQATIMGVVFLPGTQEALIAVGHPCQAQWQRVRMHRPDDI